MSTARAQDAAPTCTTGSGFGEGCWSVGVGVIATKLQPDDSQSVWKVVDDSDVGYKLSVEYRFREHWFFELGYADLGSASVRNRNPAIVGREPIDYSTPSAFAGFLLFDEAQRFNVHAKVGYATLSTDAASYVIEKQQHSDQIAVGAGDPDAVALGQHVMDRPHPGVAPLRDHPPGTVDDEDPLEVGQH